MLGLGLTLGLIPLPANARTKPIKIACYGKGLVSKLVSDINKANRNGTGTITLVNRDCVFDLTHPDPTQQPNLSGPRGLPLITGKITINGNGLTIERSSKATSNFGILAVAEGGQLILNGVTLKGGKASGHYGGAIYNSPSGIVVLNNSFVSDNSAVRGGGIANRGSVTLNNSTVDHNTAANGGGIYTNAGHPGRLVMKSSHVDNNTALRNGGGITTDGGTVELDSNSTVSGNTATLNGGGIYLDAGLASTSKVTISSSHVNNNKAGRGGGIQNNNGTVHVIAHSTITGNKAVGSGKKLKGDGGGIDNTHYLTITDSTINDNTAARYGGGIYNSKGAWSPTLTNNTITGNKPTNCSNVPDCTD